MNMRLFWRRSAAAAGIYASVLVGFLGTVIAAHAFSTRVLGLYALVLAATGFFQTLLDLTVEEALVKYGFRFQERADWGRLRRRYDIRAFFLFLSMALRLAGIAVGTRYGLTETIAGIVAAQVLATAAVLTAGGIAFRRGPRVAAAPIGPGPSGVARFVVQSSLATGVVSLRSTLSPLLLGLVASPSQVGY